MFILGGWGGSLEFLNDLWIYRWEADIWMQLSPYTSGPTTRRGHVAVWDPVSKSILLHAGAATFEATSNSSETSSHGATSYYSSELWNYSTLSNVWTQMALDSVSGTPSGRMDHAAASWLATLSDELFGALRFRRGQGVYMSLVGKTYFTSSDPHHDISILCFDAIVRRFSILLVGPRVVVVVVCCVVVVVVVVIVCLWLCVCDCVFVDVFAVVLVAVCL